MCICKWRPSVRHVDFTFLSFPVAEIKHPDKSNLREKGFALVGRFRLQPVTVGHAQQQKLRAAAHVKSSVTVCQSTGWA